MLNQFLQIKLHKYNVCLYTHGQVSGNTLNTNSGIQLPETLFTSRRNVIYDVTFVARLFNMSF